YKNERAAFLPFLIASPILFLIGAALVYFFFTPMVMWFFLAMEQGGGEGQVSIQLLPKVSEYLSLIMSLIFAFGLVFQLPVISSLLVRTGFIDSQALADKRKYAIVIAFVVAAVLTPPDPVSQIGLALPAILLYEISIYTARLIERQRARASNAKDAENEAAATPDEADYASLPGLPQVAAGRGWVSIRGTPGTTMLDIKWIRDNADALDAALAKRGASPLAKALIDLDEKRRSVIQTAQDMQSRRNAASKEIGAAMAAKNAELADRLK